MCAQDGTVGQSAIGRGGDGRSRPCRRAGSPAAAGTSCRGTERLAAPQAAATAAGRRRAQRSQQRRVSHRAMLSETTGQWKRGRVRSFIRNRPAPIDRRGSRMRRYRFPDDRTLSGDFCISAPLRTPSSVIIVAMPRCAGRWRGRGLLSGHEASRQSSSKTGVAGHTAVCAI